VRALAIFAIIFVVVTLMPALAGIASASASDAQLYWYYYLDSMWGSCRAELDGLAVYPPMGGGGLIGGRWVTLEPGTHTLTLKYYIEEDRVHDEQLNDKPLCVVRLGDSAPDSPPNMPSFYEGHFWILSIKHPWVWNQTYTTITWNNEPVRVYTKVATLTVNPDGTISISGDGYGNLGEYVPTNETTTTTTMTTTTTATATTTTPPSTTVNVIGTVTDTVRSNPAAALAIGAGAAGALGILIVIMRRW